MGITSSKSNTDKSSVSVKYDFYLISASKLNLEPPPVSGNAVVLSKNNENSTHYTAYFVKNSNWVRDNEERKSVTIKDWKIDEPFIGEQLRKTRNNVNARNALLALAGIPSLSTQIPDVLEHTICSFLDPIKDLKELMRTSSNVHGIFTKSHNTNVNTLLRYVVHNKTDFKARFFMKSPLLLQLLTTKGKVIDYSGRIFNNITAFQYAIWAKNQRMWELLLEYLPDEKAKEQLEEHEAEIGSYISVHGKYYTPNDLIVALNRYVEYFNHPNFNWPDAAKLWLQLVEKQRMVPLHIDNLCCRPHGIFDKSFANENKFRRWESDSFISNAKFADWLIVNNINIPLQNRIGNSVNAWNFYIPSPTNVCNTWGVDSNKARFQRLSNECLEKAVLMFDMQHEALQALKLRLGCDSQIAQTMEQKTP